MKNVIDRELYLAERDERDRDSPPLGEDVRGISDDADEFEGADEDDEENIEDEDEEEGSF